MLFKDGNNQTIYMCENYIGSGYQSQKSRYVSTSINVKDIKFDTKNK
jgi:hypothetical protein